MHILNPLHIHLTGKAIIEASAGTGKTFTIALLYLRLLLEKKLPVEQILVVTFTVPATAELRDRIRCGIRQALDAFSAEPEPADAFLAELLGRCPKDEAIPLLHRALTSFDEAAIFTIHGFCQRLLTENAFESGALFETELVTDQHPLLQGAIEDFWRRNIYPGPGPWSDYLRGLVSTPDNLLALLHRFLHGAKPFLLTGDDLPDPDQTDCRFLETATAMRTMWNEERQTIAALLLEEKVLHGGKYKKTSIPHWLDEMAHWLAGNRPPPHLFANFHKFTTPVLQEGTNKGQTTPEHPFFTLCDRMLEIAAIFERRTSRFKKEAIETVRQTVGEKKRRRNLLFFDDLLTSLHGALIGEGGARLARTIRDRYPAALIDEFQDTDPIQYSIFHRVYEAPGTTLFLIGDPKQAIYGFRGADIFAYIDAVHALGTPQTLGTNWRSEPGLIRAVNTLFAAPATPFLFPEINFQAVSPSPIDDEKRELLTIDEEEPAPLTLWFVSRRVAPVGRSGKITKTWAEQAIAESCATEIARLLTLGATGRARIGRKPLAAGDIAILVRSHDQAATMQRALRTHGVPSVMSSQENLFATREAKIIEQLLAAIAEPRREDLLKAALIGPIFGMDGNTLQETMDDPERWDNTISRIRAYHDLWHDKGFIRMFRHVLNQEHAMPRILAASGGERQLTNILHCGEILEEAALTEKLGVSGLLKWLRQQRLDPGARDEQQLRLESDEMRVKIVTIHKSKGLEYPVVFCPYLWNGKLHSDKGINKQIRENLRKWRADLEKLASGPVSDMQQDALAELIGRIEETVAPLTPVAFHDPNNANRMSLDLGTRHWYRHFERSWLEEQAENLRLLYVAVTRARHRCYLVWGGFTDFATSPLAALLHPPPADLPCLEDPEQLRNWQAGIANLTDSELYDRLADLARQADGAILLADLPLPSRQAPPETATPVEFSCRRFTGIIQRDWQVASFTSLAAGYHQTERPDRDQGDMGGQPQEAAKDPIAPIFAFPRGARPGSLIHKIFELLDFTVTDPEAIKTLVANTLRQFTLAEQWTEPLATMVRNVLDTPLNNPAGTLRLADIAGDRRLNELEFYYPLNRITPELLTDILAQGGSDQEGLHFAPARGFIKGFIDLIFEHNGRYYIADYKSNHLGNSLDDYAPTRLAEVMRRDRYTLQYHLYSVALHRYLSHRLQGYSYKDHFGGVYYLFVRGMQPATGQKSGVFFHRPDESCIAALSAALADPGEEGRR